MTHCAVKYLVSIYKEFGRTFTLIFKKVSKKRTKKRHLTFLMSIYSFFLNNMIELHEMALLTVIIRIYEL